MSSFTRTQLATLVTRSATTYNILVWWPRLIIEKKSLIDKMYGLSLLTSYDRLIQTSTDMDTTVCVVYDEEEGVCPPTLMKAVFQWQLLITLIIILHIPQQTIRSIAELYRSLTMCQIQLQMLAEIWSRDASPREKEMEQHPSSHTIVPSTVLKTQNPTLPSSFSPSRPSVEQLPQSSLN